MDRPSGTMHYRPAPTHKSMHLCLPQCTTDQPKTSQREQGETSRRSEDGEAKRALGVDEWEWGPRDRLCASVQEGRNNRASGASDKPSAGKGAKCARNGKAGGHASPDAAGNKTKQIGTASGDRRRSSILFNSRLTSSNTSCDVALLSIKKRGYLNDHTMFLLVG
ncbi:hypothetical protein K438DRAFT_1789559 [Mycena galopus ATCC 62051]|nr:hypothetical protein K438DRAFT_1789559 [Mycena galopus ATCC 62051]